MPLVSFSSERFPRSQPQGLTYGNADALPSFRPLFPLPPSARARSASLPTYLAPQIRKPHPPRPVSFSSTGITSSSSDDTLVGSDRTLVGSDQTDVGKLANNDKTQEGTRTGTGGTVSQKETDDYLKGLDLGRLFQDEDRMQVEEVFRDVDPTRAEEVFRDQEPIRVEEVFERDDDTDALEEIEGFKEALRLYRMLPPFAEPSSEELGDIVDRLFAQDRLKAVLINGKWSAAAVPAAAKDEGSQHEEPATVWLIEAERTVAHMKEVLVNRPSLSQSLRDLGLVCTCKVINDSLLFTDDFLHSYKRPPFEPQYRWSQYAQSECVYVEGVESGSFSPEVQAILKELGGELEVPLFFTGRAKTRLIEDTISGDGNQSAQGRPDIEGQMAEVGKGVDKGQVKGMPESGGNEGLDAKTADSAVQSTTRDTARLITFKSEYTDQDVFLKLHMTVNENTFNENSFNENTFTMEMGAQSKPMRASVGVDSIVFAADVEDPAVWELLWNTESAYIAGDRQQEHSRTTHWQAHLGPAHLGPAQASLEVGQEFTSSVVPPPPARLQNRFINLEVGCCGSCRQAVKGTPCNRLGRLRDWAKVDMQAAIQWVAGPRPINLKTIVECTFTKRVENTPVPLRSEVSSILQMTAGLPASHQTNLLAVGRPSSNPRQGSLRYSVHRNQAPRPLPLPQRFRTENWQTSHDLEMVGGNVRQNDNPAFVMSQQALTERWWARTPFG